MRGRARSLGQENGLDLFTMIEDSPETDQGLYFSCTSEEEEEECGSLSDSPGLSLHTPANGPAPAGGKNRHRDQYRNQNQHRNRDPAPYGRHIKCQVTSRPTVKRRPSLMDKARAIFRKSRTSSSFRTAGDVEETLVPEPRKQPGHSCTGATDLSDDEEDEEDDMFVAYLTPRSLQRYSEDSGGGGSPTSEVVPGIVSHKRGISRRSSFLESKPIRTIAKKLTRRASFSTSAARKTTFRNYEVDR